MDSYLLNLGISDVQIRKKGTEQAICKEELEKLMNTILDVEFFISSLERKGIIFREFLSKKNSEGELPQYQVGFGDHIQYLYSEEELIGAKNQHEEEQRKVHRETIASVPVEERTEEMTSFHPKRLPFLELFDKNDLKNHIAGTKAFWFEIGTIFRYRWWAF